MKKHQNIPEEAYFELLTFYNFRVSITEKPTGGPLKPILAQLKGNCYGFAIASALCTNDLGLFACSFPQFWDIGIDRNLRFWIYGAWRFSLHFDIPSRIAPVYFSG